MIYDLALLIAGIVILTLGADWMVRGAVLLSHRLGISAIVIGVTVVSLGTSAPELGVSLVSVFKGKPDLVLGNVVGSNIFNILVVLGLTSLISPLQVHSRVIRVELPILLLFSGLLWILGLDQSYSLTDALILAGLMPLYLLLQLWFAKRDRSFQAEASEEVKELLEKKRTGPVWITLYFLVGMAGLSFGAQWFVVGASELAYKFGVDELIVGLTIIAFGTSLPELATSVSASIKGHTDIAVGNVVGSNIFNIGFVLGATPLISQKTLSFGEAALRVDIPLMVIASVACLPIFITKYRIGRIEAALFVTTYALYSVYLYFRATNTPLPW